MKKFLFPAVALVMVAAACTDKNPQPAADADATPAVDTLVADWAQNSIPMPLSYVVQFPEDYDPYSDDIPVEKSLRHVFTSEEDSLQYSPIASTYHVMVAEGKKYDTKYLGVQPNGKEYGELIGADYAYCMRGLNYQYAQQETGGFAFNDEFLKTHEIIELKYPQTKAPKTLTDSLATRYGNKVLKSTTCAVSTDGKYSIYSVQMKPKDGKCMGLRVVDAEGQLYILEELCEEYNDQSAWHVDDEGEYYPLAPIALTKSAKGLDIFYLEGACESTSYAALLVRDDKIENYEFNGYYNAVDYVPSPDPVQLPESAELKAELDGFKVWINTDVEPTEDDPMGAYSVYYKNQYDDNIYFLVKTCGNLDPLRLWGYEYPYVSHKEVMAADEAYIVKKPETEVYYLILQGCPDARNIYTYMLYLPCNNVQPSFRWVRTNEGFRGVDGSGNLLMFNTYRYHEEGGRYSVCQFYDFNMNLVNEMNEEEE